MSNRWQDERDEALNAIEACPAKPSAPKPSTGELQKPVSHVHDYGEVYVPQDYVPHYSANLRNVTHDI